MIENMLKITKHWQDHFEPKSQHHKKNRIGWVMLFTNLVQFFDQKKKLKLEATLCIKTYPH